MKRATSRSLTNSPLQEEEITPSQSNKRSSKLTRTYTIQLNSADVSPIAVVPEFITQLQCASRTKLKITTNQLATMICSPGPGVSKKPFDLENRKESSIFKFEASPAIQEVDENDIDDDKTVKSNNFEPVFEEFGVIGLENLDLKAELMDADGLGNKVRVEPRMLYHWKSSKTQDSHVDEEDKNSITGQLKNFIYPFGCFVHSGTFSSTDEVSLSQVSDSRSISPTKVGRRTSLKDTKPLAKENLVHLLVQEYIMKDQLNNDSPNCFFLCFNSDETLNQEKAYKSRYVQLANPNMYYSYYCLMKNELIALVYHI